ncbi:hypothetical protein DY000_02037722 [Brassica cretica]|uniref:Uncharacterized protein n=1 Tax=Brassica cretica TaxID=69181 RepID=A0ABQ7BN16_BRACR|nr:hypothetical protein DY000_02037722 [Brassica cretica]
MQSQEKKSPTDPPSVRRLVNQLKQEKDVLLNVKGQSGKEKSERRLKEAVELLKLITSR